MTPGWKIRRQITVIQSYDVCPYRIEEPGGESCLCMHPDNLGLTQDWAHCTLLLCPIYHKMEEEER